MVQCAWCSDLVWCSMECRIYLLGEAGADPDARDRFGLRPIDYAPQVPHCARVCVCARVDVCVCVLVAAAARSRQQLDAAVARFRRLLAPHQHAP